MITETNDKRSKYKRGQRIMAASGNRCLLICNVHATPDKNRRKLYDVMFTDDNRYIREVTASQIKNMIDDVPKPRIKRNSCIDYYGTKLKFNDIDKELGLKKGSTIRYFNRNGRDEKKVIDRITDHRLKRRNK